MFTPCSTYVDAKRTGWAWLRATTAELCRSLAEHELRARHHARVAGQSLAWRNYDTYLDHLQWQRWHERKVETLQRKITNRLQQAH